MHTRCDFAGIGVPIVQVPMAGAFTPELAAAITNAGGLSCLPFWALPPDKVASALQGRR